MELEGIIEAIIYKNEINSYTIAKMVLNEPNEDIQDTEITIVGYMPFVVEGDTLKINGKLVEHKEYGEQFKVEMFEKLMPQTLDALEKYLANGTIKGIGPATAKKIVNTFKEETINTIKYQPLKLAQIKGITKEKSIEISESFIENWEIWQIVGFLEKFGIGAESAKKVYDKLGVDAIEQIEANPYILIDIVRGVDFNQIDKKAMEIGIEKNNDKRIKSGIKYALIRSTYNGHCCVIKENLIQYVQNLLDVSFENIENTLINLKSSGEIVEENRGDEEIWIYLDAFYNVEATIANRIYNLNNFRNVKYIKNFEKELKTIEKNSKINFSEKQIEAIKAVNENNITIVTGGPGTGKTTIVKTIIDIYKEKDKKVVLAAPTGRAAKRMTETTGEEASTLHRLLEIGKFSEEAMFDKNIDYRGVPIDADVVIVDEMSMVDIFLFNYLLSSIYQGTKLILIGDSDQLQSVGPGSVLKDLIESEKIKTIHLEEVFRQAAKSQIIVNAHRVNEGIGFLTKQELEEDSKQDFFVINESNQGKIISEVMSLCTGRLKKYGDYDFFENIQILTPTKKGELGTKELNKNLQKILNPESISKNEKQANGAIYRIGDRIMQVKNNYDIYWEKHNGKFEAGTGVFNGEIGTISNIDEVNKSIEIEFDDGKVALYAFSDLEQIEHSYSITIHKAQGSEFDVVILVIPRTSPMLLTRNLLYTAITRAKKLLIIIGDKNIINFMINNVDSKKRNTGLKYKIQSLFESKE